MQAAESFFLFDTEEMMPRAEMSFPVAHTTQVLAMVTVPRI